MNDSYEILQVPRDLLATLTLSWQMGLDFHEEMNQLRAILAAPAVERQAEPEAFMYQHDETGQIGFIDIQQIEWGFEKNNPRLKIICPLYRSPPAPVTVLPTPISSEDGPHYSDNRASELGYLAGYNACIDKIKEMNR